MVDGDAANVAAASVVVDDADDLDTVLEPGLPHDWDGVVATAVERDAAMSGPRELGGGAMQDAVAKPADLPPQRIAVMLDIGQATLEFGQCGQGVEPQQFAVGVKLRELLESIEQTGDGVEIWRGAH